MPAPAFLVLALLASPAPFLSEAHHSIALSPGEGTALSPRAGTVLSPDEGDEESAFIAGLAKRGLNDMVVREANKFLKRRPDHRRAPAVRYRLADAYYELERIEEALAQYTALEKVKGFEQGAEVRFRVGQCALELGNLDRAARAFRGVKASDAEYLRVPATYLLAEALFRAESFAEAGEAYGEVLDAGDAAGEYARDARYGLVWSAWKGGDRPGTVAAAEAFTKAHAGDAQTGEIAFLAGEALLESGRSEEALAWYARVTAGEYVEGALRGSAFAVAGTGDHAAAAQRFAAYLDRFPDGRFASEAALQQGVQLVRADRFADAVVALERPNAPKDAVADYWRALAYAGSGAHDRALACAEAGLEKSPDDELAGRLRTACGDALFELGRGDEAARYYEQSGDAYAVHAAAVARLNAGDAEEAERLARTLLAGAAREPGAPYRAEALVTHAEALFRLERYADAEGPLRALIGEARPRDDGGAPATRVEPAAVSRATSRLAWCRWYADDAAGAAPLFVAVADDVGAGAAERGEARFMAARCALAAGDEPAAAASFRAYLEEVPEGPHAAESQLRLARIVPEVEAAPLYEAVVARGADPDLVIAALSELAELRLAAQNLPAAEAAYAALVERFPDDAGAPSARYGLGWSRYQQKNFQGAAEPLWAVARDKAASEDLRVGALELLVWVERGAGRAPLALAAFKAFAARTQDEARVLGAARIADAALEAANEPAKRAELWTEVGGRVQAPASVAAVAVEQAFLALDAGDVPGATDGLARASAAQPESPAVAELSFFVGEAYFDADDDERAAALYAQAAKSGAPEVAERALYKGGFAELRRGRTAEATSAFVELVERFPASALAPESMFLAGEACYRAGDDEGAVKWLRRMTEEAPKHASRPKALFRLGLAEGRLERWRQSVDALSELIATTPEFTSVAEAELWRGRGLSRLGERRASRQSLGRVVEADEGILAAQARIELGRLHEAEKDDESAVAEYLKVAVLYGHAEECAEALVRAGDVLARTGKKDQAAERYREAVDDYPKTAWAAEATKRLKR
ncbi:MAG: tetratricopeptide repeat protein [Planctomycetota bacterium]